MFTAHPTEAVRRALLDKESEVVRCLVCISEGKWPNRLHDVEELEKIILEQYAEKGETA